MKSNSDGKKTYPQSREHHFVVPLQIDEAAEYVPDMGYKRIKVAVEKATPEERNFRLDFEDDPETRVYVRLSVWNATETRVEMSLSKRFYLPPNILMLIALAISVLTIIGLAIEDTRPFLILIFVCAFMVLGIYFAFNQNQITQSTKQDIMAMIRARKIQGYIMDAVVERFKNEGAAVLSERPSHEDLLQTKLKNDPEMWLEDDTHSRKSKRV